MEQAYDKLARRVMKTALKAGRLEAEVYLLDSRELSVEVADNKVENLKLAEEKGLGLRIIKDSTLGYAFTSDLSSKALDKVVEKALQNAGETPEDRYWQLTKPGMNYPKLNLYDENTFRISLEEKIELAKAIENAARKYDPRIVITEKAVYHDSQYHLSVFNTLGLAEGYRGSYCGGYAVVVAQDKGESETGFAMQYKPGFKDLFPDVIGREAGEKCIRMLGGKRIASARLPVVFDPYCMTSLMGLLLTPFSADAVIKGKSFFQDRIGKTVASPMLSIIDDGSMKDGLGSSPFDGEGSPTARTVLLDKGILRTFLHNNYTAHRLGAASTGNGVRYSYRSTPEVGLTNFYIEPGPLSHEKIIKDVAKGFYLTDLMGLHTANPISGDFSVGAAGLMIENGELTTPVKGVAVAGNLQEILNDIEAVGCDLTFYASKGAPTIRIKSLSISGI